MKRRTTVALPVLVLALLTLALVVAACAGPGTTTTTQAANGTTQAAVTATQPLVTTTQAAVTTTQPPATTSALDPARESRLDEFLRNLEQNNKLMGGVVITQNGQLMYENYLGSSSVEDEIKNGPVTKFRVGSITKMFTATMILQLIEEGRLTLDTKLAAFYPQIQNSESITISEMLGHRSGIHNFTDDPEYFSYAFVHQSKEQMLARLAAMKPDFQPNEKFEYSNSNYVLLGYMLEDATESTYKSEVKRRVVDRIGLANTSYGDAILTKEDYAASYVVQAGNWSRQPETDMSVPGGAGAIVSTPRDLNTFIAALFDHKLMSQQSLDQMLELQDGYGKGIASMPVETNLGYGHDGQIDAFWSQSTYFPDTKVAVAVVANGMGCSFDKVWTGISKVYFNLPVKMPDFRPLSTPDVAGTIAFVNPVRGATADIYVVNSDGGGLSPVTQTSDRWEEHPCWSPDGKRIVYNTFIPGDAVMDTLTVQVANADGSERAQLGEGKSFFPAWSPDGKHIVFASLDGKASLPPGVLVMNPDGSDVKGLIHMEVFAFPSWAPNGDILFLRDWDLYSMKPDGGAPVRLTTGKDIGGYALSPDGKTLAYFDRGKKAILTMPLAGDRPATTLLETEWLIEDAPFVALSWSPDGKAIALASNMLDDGQPSPLYIVNADGSGLSQVPGVDTAFDPVWRPM